MLTKTVIVVSVAMMASPVQATPQQAPTSFERVNVCERIAGATIASALSGTLVDARQVNTPGMTAARCIYGIEIGGTRRAFVVWLGPASDYDGLRKAAEGEVTAVAGVGEVAHQTFDAETKRYWLRAMKPGVATVQVSGERPEWLRTIATLALSKL